MIVWKNFPCQLHFTSSIIPRSTQGLSWCWILICTFSSVTQRLHPRYTSPLVVISGLTFAVVQPQISAQALPELFQVTEAPWWCFPVYAASCHQRRLPCALFLTCLQIRNYFFLICVHVCVGNKLRPLGTAWNRDAVASGLRRMAELPKCGIVLISIFLPIHDKVQHVCLEGPVLAPWTPNEC